MLSAVPSVHLSSRAREAVYVASVFFSAFLLFLVQPMLARLLLPVYGGSPAVWNTCMVFFQAILLGGYAYAHGSLRWLGIARQPMVHALLLAGSLFFLPHAPTPAALSGSYPVGSIVVTLATIAGIPFFLLSANSSLSQRWFSVSAFKSSADPFWLYAASNVGSLLALLSYPLLVEPMLGLNAQLRWWSAGYCGFVGLSFVSMYLARNGMQAAAAIEPVDAGRMSSDVVTHSVTRGRRVRWIIRSAIATSLLLSMTMQITADVVTAPLFWVLPLALYLVTFIVAFSPSQRPQRRTVAYATMIGIALCLILLIIPTFLPLWFALLALLGTLFAGALLCHGDLADDRPPASGLTEFYLWIAVGGVAGGLANGIFAPMVFDTVAEYPLTLIALAFMLQRESPSLSLASLRQVARTPAAPLMIAATVIASAAVLAERRLGIDASPDSALLQWQFTPVAVLLCGLLFSAQPRVFALSASLAALFAMGGLHFRDPIVHQGRSFFGVSRVTDNDVERVLIHGVTVHGSQRKDSVLRHIPTAYYYPAGPIGWAITHAPPSADIGVVGLGAGSVASLATAGQRLTFYEIDPLVEEIARRDFTFIRDSKAAVAVQIGDGRQLIERVSDERFDLLVLDAFSSDAIPTHLLTDEAIALYLRKIKPGGLLVIHISNRYADLTRVFRGWQQRTGRRVAINQYVPTGTDADQGVRATVAVAIGRSNAAVRPLAETRQWFWIEPDGPSVHWTDDHVNLLAVLNSNVLKP